MNYDVFSNNGTWIAIIHVQDGKDADVIAKHAWGIDVYAVPAAPYCR